MDEHRKRDEKGLKRLVRVERERAEHRHEAPAEGSHVVFDFTGLHRPEVADLALILTARLQAPAAGYVWVRALDARTARILAGLGLDHLFRHYPKSDVLN